MEALGLEKVRRHIFLCADAKEAKCCPAEKSAAAWDFLKARLKELNLVGPNPLVFRSKAACLRVCVQGPVAVVYPEGIWYTYVDQTDIDEIVDSHLRDGVPVARLRIDA